MTEAFPHLRLVLCAAAVALALCAALSVPARASRTQFTIMQDDPQIVYHGATVRARRIAELHDQLGVSVLKIRVSWASLAPGGRHVPSRNLADPASYRAAVWAEFDDAIRRANLAGMQVYLELGGDTPYWANHVGGGRQDRKSVV